MGGMESGKAGTLGLRKLELKIYGLSEVDFLVLVRDGIDIKVRSKI